MFDVCLIFARSERYVAIRQSCSPRHSTSPSISGCRCAYLSQSFAFINRISVAGYVLELVRKVGALIASCSDVSATGAIRNLSQFDFSLSQVPGVSANILMCDAILGCVHEICHDIKGIYIDICAQKVLIFTILFCFWKRFALFYSTATPFQ